MEQLQEPSPVAIQSRRQPLFLRGFWLMVAGLAIYMFQLFVQKALFVTPWYVPVLTSMGVLLMAISAWRRPGLLRIAGVFVFAALCGFEWFFLLSGSKVPAYTGPAQTGTKIPSFHAVLANGSPFTHIDLEHGSPTVLLFFRGRW